MAEMLMSYGEQFRRLRERRGLTQEAVAAALKYKRAAPVSLIERKSTKVPRPKTIKKHALALACEPWELLAGVPTEYDWLRTPRPLTTGEMGILLFGLAHFSPANLDAMFGAGHRFLAVPALRSIEPIQVLLRALETPEKDVRTARGKRRA